MFRRRPPTPAPDAPFRRALAETLADARLEVQSAGSIWGRARRMLTGALAVLRLIAGVGTVFEEGYPMRNLGRDVRYGARRLAASPVFTIFAVVTLALGMGATTAFVSVVRATTGPPSGVRDPTTIVNLYHTATGAGLPGLELSWPDYQDFKAAQTSFERVMAWTPMMPTLTANDESMVGFGEAVDGDYFAVLGVRPALGRALADADMGRNAPAVAVISDSTWRRLFAQASDVVGRTVLIDGHPFHVVGVAPPEFSGLFDGGLVPTTVWIPLSGATGTVGFGGRSPVQLGDREDRAVLVKGRLRPGRTIVQAQTEVSAIAGRLDRTVPLGATLGPRYRGVIGLHERPWTVERVSDVVVTEGQAAFMRPLRNALVIAVGLVLLVACTNLANLSLARWSGRRLDLALRHALGASRAQLMTETLVEGALVVLAGAALAFLVTRVLLVLLTTDFQVGSLILRMRPSSDLDVAALSALALLVAFTVTGFVPAWQATRLDLRSFLASDAVGTAVPRWRGRQWLISLQVSVSLGLLAVATAAGSTLIADLRHDSGIVLDQLAVGKVDFRSEGAEPEHTRLVVDQIVRALSHAPGIRDVAATSGLPFGALTPLGRVETVDRALDPAKPGGQQAVVLAVTPSVFRTWGLKAVDGRFIVDGDGPAAEPVALVSETAATFLFGTTRAVGRRLQVQRPRQPGLPPPAIASRTIVGVLADTDVLSYESRLLGAIYVPLAQEDASQVVFTVRATGRPDALLSPLRQTIRSADPGLAIAPLETAVTAAGASSIFLQASVGIAGSLGVFALALALTGLYGALSYVVTSRTREMGIRLSLGATKPELTRLVVVEGVQPVIMGVIIGLFFGWLGSLGLQPFFRHGITLPLTSPFVMGIAPALMLVAGALAAYLPARRAARVDPNITLRAL